ncbi:sodium-dependent transporter [Kordiimonas pumila]|uniref:Sodium-dependent transporter n=1 Tax=Kordiimonas pumila TaxID=2161677 RepID=A0ABV7D019_9PROT|nr:sodium-dependent transporter [Kordiimonas pumila]
MAAAKEHSNWSSKWTFIMAAVGSAVGLGNIWRFPYEAGQGGGGAFVLMYLGFVFLIGTPVLVAELSLGRRGQLSPIGSMLKIAKEEGRSSAWQLVGWSGVLGSFIVLSFYSVIGGWTLSYIIQSIIGAFDGITAEAAGALFGTMLASPVTMILWHAGFISLTMFIVAKGVEGGLEKAVTILMPALFILLIALVIYAAVAGDFAQAVSFLFKPDFSKVTFSVALEALGQSFFSLSLGLGSMMTYGSYLKKDTSVGKSAVIIASADTAVALLAGLAIFPLVFAYNLDLSSGPGLIFVTLPIAFGQMHFGVIFGALFFALLVIAAITSSISLLEPSVSYLQEKTGYTRKKAALSIGFGTFMLGILTVFSFNLLADFTFAGMTLFDLFDFLTNNLMMPLAGMFMALFMGWFILRKNLLEELAMTEKWFKLWYFLVRFVCPLAIGAVFVFLLYEKFVA